MHLGIYQCITKDQASQYIVQDTKLSLTHTLPTSQFYNIITETSPTSNYHRLNKTNSLNETLNYEQKEYLGLHTEGGMVKVNGGGTLRGRGRRWHARGRGRRWHALRKRTAVACCKGGGVEVDDSGAIVSRA
jgi:hypothetical protein